MPPDAVNDGPAESGLCAHVYPPTIASRLASFLLRSLFSLFHESAGFGFMAQKGENRI